MPPKLQEIAEGIGINSRGVAHRYVQALTDAGFIETDNGKHVILNILPEGQMIGLPALFSNNVFPYSESTRQQLRLIYGIGGSYRDYHEITIWIFLLEKFHLRH